MTEWDKKKEEERKRKEVKLWKNKRVGRYPSEMKELSRKKRDKKESRNKLEGFNV